MLDRGEQEKAPHRKNRKLEVIEWSRCVNSIVKRGEGCIPSISGFESEDPDRNRGVNGDYGKKSRSN